MPATASMRLNPDFALERRCHIRAVQPDGEFLKGSKRYTVKRLQGTEVRGRMELMQASFDDAFPDIPLPKISGQGSPGSTL